MQIQDLYDIDNNKAYKKLLELELLTINSNELYVYFEEFLKMLNHPKMFIRIRGFRLLCYLAKWDIDNKINKNINIILDELDDNNGVAIRQCLSKINLILLYKVELSDIIKNKLESIDILKYKETMQSLIRKDIENILINL